MARFAASFVSNLASDRRTRYVDADCSWPVSWFDVVGSVDESRNMDRSAGGVSLGDWLALPEPRKPNGGLASAYLRGNSALARRAAIDGKASVSIAQVAPTCGSNPEQL